MVALERAFGPRQQAEGLRPVDRLRGGIVYIAEKAKAAGGKAATLGRTVVGAVTDGLSALPQPLAGNIPPVSADKAIKDFIANGRIHASSELGGGGKMFSAPDGMIVYKGNVATILPSTDTGQGSPNIKD